MLVVMVAGIACSDPDTVLPCMLMLKWPGFIGTLDDEPVALLWLLSLLVVTVVVVAVRVHRQLSCMYVCGLSMIHA